MLIAFIKKCRPSCGKGKPERDADTLFQHWQQ